jgi:hypothetical protein
LERIILQNKDLRQADFDFKVLKKAKGHALVPPSLEIWSTGDAAHGSCAGFQLGRLAGDPQ